MQFSMWHDPIHDRVMFSGWLDKRSVEALPITHDEVAELAMAGTSAARLEWLAKLFRKEENKSCDAPAP